MYKPLVPCPDCRRHVRTHERDCPFCGAGLPTDLDKRALPPARQRLSRAAAFVFSATIVSAVAGAAACSGDVEDGRSSADDDGSSDGLWDGDGSGDDGIGVAEYGAPVPPPDAGPDDDGGMQAKYGAAPPPDDAGVSDDGGGSADYGAPPPQDAG